MLGTQYAPSTYFTRRIFLYASYAEFMGRCDVGPVIKYSYAYLELSYIVLHIVSYIVLH